MYLHLVIALIFLDDLAPKFSTIFDWPFVVNVLLRFESNIWDWEWNQ